MKNKIISLVTNKYIYIPTYMHQNLIIFGVYNLEAAKLTLIGVC